MNPKNRPAETGGIAGAVALVIAHLLGVTDPTMIVCIGVIVGFIPAAITWTVQLTKGQKKNAPE